MWAWRGLVKAVLCPRLSTPKPGGEGAGLENRSCRGGGFYWGVLVATPPCAPGRAAGERGAPLRSRGRFNAGHCAPRDKAPGLGSDWHPHQHIGVLPACTPLLGVPELTVGQVKPPRCAASQLERVGKSVPHPHPVSPILTLRLSCWWQVSQVLTVRSTSMSVTLTRATTGPARTASPPSPASASPATRATAATSTSTSARASPAKMGAPARTGTTPTTASASKGPQVSRRGSTWVGSAGAASHSHPLPGAGWPWATTSSRPGAGASPGRPGRGRVLPVWCPAQAGTAPQPGAAHGEGALLWGGGGSWCQRGSFYCFGGSGALLMTIFSSWGHLNNPSLLPRPQLRDQPG